MKLSLGYNDVPYDNRPETPRRVAQARPGRRRRPLRRQGGSGGQVTTGDVGEIIERRYNLVERFVGLNDEAIGAAIETSLAGSIENMLMGGVVGNPLAAAESEIEQMFKSFLDRGGMDGYAWGVPTAAAERGYNPRLAHPYSKSNPARPSFIASGTLQANFKVQSSD